ncbi:MAG: response regulator [Deltaproteobacteria bacterium]|nr:response regulator [Deltaproteobacteria bacterium]
MKILVVDDEGIILDSCRRVLEEDGLDVLLVTSADKAIAAIEDEEPSVLLMDVKMPVRDGMDLMREVKERWPTMPIIVMSGYHTTETIEEADKMGAVAFINKPFTPDELLETIRQVIQKEEHHGEKEDPGN